MNEDNKNKPKQNPPKQTPTPSKERLQERGKESGAGANKGSISETRPIPPKKR